MNVFSVAARRHFRLGTLGILFAAIVSTLAAAEPESEPQNQRSDTRGLSFDSRTIPIDTYGAASWRSRGGHFDSGYLAMAGDGFAGANGVVVLPQDLYEVSDLDDRISSLSFHAWIRVGGGSGELNGGFSINFVRPGDPLLDGKDVFAPAPDGQRNLPEEGATTGISIGFDLAQNGPRSPKADAWLAMERLSEGEALPPDTQSIIDALTPSEIAYFEAHGAECGPEADHRESIVYDCIGISVRVDGDLVAQRGSSAGSGGLHNAANLLTELGDGGLDWASVQIGIAPNLEKNQLMGKVLTVFYKDQLVIEQAIDYPLFPHLFVFGARSNGRGTVVDIDEVVLNRGPAFTNGDFNLDGAIDLADYRVLLQNMNANAGWFNGDINYDGVVDLDDFTAFRSEYAHANRLSVVTVPESQCLSASKLWLVAVLCVFLQRAGRVRVRTFCFGRRTLSANDPGIQDTVAAQAQRLRRGSTCCSRAPNSM